MSFEELLQRDLLDYPIFLDWPCKVDNYHNMLYTDPSNNFRKVLYRNDSISDHDTGWVCKTNDERFTYFFHNKIHRINGPAIVEKINHSHIFFNNEKIDSRRNYTNYTVEWQNKGVLHRKKHPAFYAYRQDKNISNVILEWHEKSKNNSQGTCHRLGGPAIHRFGEFFKSDIIYYIYGKKYSEFQYWMYIFKHHKNVLPKVEYEKSHMIRFKKNIRKPAPTLIDIDKRKVYYNLYPPFGNLKNCPSAKYWDNVHKSKYFKKDQSKLLPLQ